MEIVYVNIYQDEKGRYLSDDDYSTYKDAYDNRDDLANYVKTVGIIIINSVK